METQLSENQIITLNRGDSLEFPFLINIGTIMQPFRYVLKDGEVLYFAVMEPNQRFEDALIKKVYTNQDEMTESGDIVIKFIPEDTEYVTEGTYYYCVKLRQIQDDKEYVTTLVPKTLFYIV